MSRIYFHSETNESEVRGSERAYAAHLCNEMFLTAIGISEYDTPEHPHVLRKIVAPNHYSLRKQGKRFEESLRIALSVNAFAPVLIVNSNPVDVFSAQLNTALIMGSDEIKLGARLNGQCEIHAYIEGKNRGWFANLIDSGRAIGILRSDVGWESVMAHLRERDDEPIVTSYSVCDQFPNAGASGWKPTRIYEDGEADWDEYYDIPDAERWAMGMKALRSSPLMEMKPDNWNSYFFGDGATGFTLLAKAIELSKTSTPVERPEGIIYK